MRRSIVKSDGQQFYKYQQNEQPHLMQPIILTPQKKRPRHITSDNSKSWLRTGTTMYVW